MCRFVAGVVTLLAGVSSSTWLYAEHDAHKSATLVVRHSFEPSEDRDFDGFPDDWTRRKGTGFPNYVDLGIDYERGVLPEESHFAAPQLLASVLGSGMAGGLGASLGETVTAADAESTIDVGRGSLLCVINGGNAAAYSPVTRVNNLYAYVFRGRIRTQRLRHNVAVISVSFLNHKRHRVQRFLTQAVSGTHKDWVEVRLGPVTPDSNVRYVVIGCHVVQGENKDISGRAWFDDLWLGRAPQLDLHSNFQTHFQDKSAPIRVVSTVSGLDRERNYQLRMELLDSFGKSIAEQSWLLDEKTRAIEQPTSGPDVANVGSPDPSAPDPAVLDPQDGTHDGSAATKSDAAVPLPSTDDVNRRREVRWTLPQQPYGFYQVEASLIRDKEVTSVRRTTFAVMDLVNNRAKGEFGWTVARPPEVLSGDELAEVAAQSGINWMKYPLWRSIESDANPSSTEVLHLFERLARRHITPVGLLNHPPDAIRGKFAKSWTGVGEVFALDTSFWRASLEPVIARYASFVQNWQLGGESDPSFLGMTGLADHTDSIKKEFDRIGRDTRLGLHWSWDSEIPSAADLPNAFLSISKNDPLKFDELIKKLDLSKESRQNRWVLLKPLAARQFSAEVRGADLVKRMVAAKIGGAEAIFAFDVFDPEFGLLTNAGSPTPLFLPWRTTAVALQNSTFLGSFVMKNGSKNFAFARDGKVAVVLWNERKVREEFFFGSETQMIDIWGNRRKVQVNSEGRQLLDVGSVPLILRSCDEFVARVRLSVKFERGKVPSEFGAHDETIMGTNFFPQGVNGEVSITIPDTSGDWTVEPNRWTVQLAQGEAFKLPMQLKLPPNASLGKTLTWIDFKLDSDRQFRFRVYRPYQVGLGDVMIEILDSREPDGRLKLEQIITNNIQPATLLNFRCSLFIPGEKRRMQLVTKLGAGQDRKFYYLSDANALRGKQLWLRAEEINGRRVLNFRWTIGRDWDQKDKLKPPKSAQRVFLGNRRRT